MGFASDLGVEAPNEKEGAAGFSSFLSENWPKENVGVSPFDSADGPKEKVDTGRDSLGSVVWPKVKVGVIFVSAETPNAGVLVDVV